MEAKIVKEYTKKGYSKEHAKRIARAVEFGKRGVAQRNQHPRPWETIAKEGERGMRTNVRAHERRKPGHVFEKTHVRAHIREIGTQGATRRRMDRRSKRARSSDNAVRAKRVGHISSAHDRKDWTKHPGDMDLAGVDSDGRHR